VTSLTATSSTAAATLASAVRCRARSSIALMGGSS
jgi:hypothetical protein